MRRRRKAYRPPEMLLNVLVLDLLEISGSQVRTARSLAMAMAQSTVSRSYREIATQFRLGRRLPPRKVCRWGSSVSLRHLRLACRAHRLEDGHLRIGTDALHQPLLEQLPGLLQVPPRFHGAGDWATLVAEGVLDGAIVSSLCHPVAVGEGKLPSWKGLRVEPLGTLELELLSPAGEPAPVLVPPEPSAPRLHQRLSEVGLEVVEVPRTCHDPGDWLQTSRLRGLALPLCPGLVEPSIRRELGLGALMPERSVVLVEQLWLLMAAGVEEMAPGARTVLRMIRRRVHRAAVTTASLLSEEDVA